MAATVVKRLLEARANPMPKNKDGHTPLMLGAQLSSPTGGKGAFHQNQHTIVLMFFCFRIRL